MLNIHKNRFVKLVTSVIVMGCSSVLQAQSPTTESSSTQAAASILEQTRHQEDRVRHLLKLGVQHIQDQGISGVNDFNQDPRFTDRELYLFALSKDGTLLASGGWSMSLIGENVVEFTDQDEKPFFKEILKQAQTADKGRIEYLWFNPADSGEDLKVTHFKVIDNIIIGSGYFPRFATEEQAKDLLELAVSEYFKQPEQALRKFKNRQSGFRNKDQYVFVLNKADRTITWTPNSPELNQTAVDQVVDIQGHAFLKQIIDTANPNLIQMIDYWWFSPISKQVEQRRAYYQQVGDSVIAVGTFVLDEAD